MQTSILEIGKGGGTKFTLGHPGFRERNEGGMERHKVGPERNKTSIQSHRSRKRDFVNVYLPVKINQDMQLTV
jgi:hypothetical protein